MIAVDHAWQSDGPKKSSLAGRNNSDLPGCALINTAIIGIDVFDGTRSKTPTPPTTVAVHSGLSVPPTRKDNWQVTSEESDAEATKVALWRKQLPLPAILSKVVVRPKVVASEFSLVQLVAHGLAANAKEEISESVNIKLRIVAAP